MTKYGANERVIFQVSGQRLRGKVTQVLPQARRVVTDTEGAPISSVAAFGGCGASWTCPRNAG